MNSVSKNLTVLTWTIYLILVIVAVSPFLYFLWPQSAAYFPPNDILTSYGGADALVLWQKILGLFVAALPNAMLCWALILVLKLIRFLKAGMWFDESCEKLSRKFSKVMLWFVFFQFIHRTLLVLVVTATRPTGEKELVISFSSDDLFAIVPVIFALIFAHIISLAREQREELKQII